MDQNNPSLPGSERELLLLRKAFENSGEVIFLTDADETITWVNPEFTRLYGYAAEEVVGVATPSILASDENSADDYKRFWDQMANGESARSEFVNVTKDGRRVTIEGTYSKVHDDQGRIAGYLAIQRDISGRQAMEKRLKDSEEFYRTLVETSPDAILLLTLEGEIRACNRRSTELFGRQLVGLGLADLLAPVERDRATRCIERAAAAQPGPSMEFSFVGSDGAALAGELNLSPITDGGGRPRGLIGVLRDVTDRKHLETQLAQAQKMEAIGRLAGGIAHDFNNLMTAVIGYADLLLQDPDLTDAARQDVSAIKKAGEKATTLTRQLMVFSRKQVLQSKTIDLNTVVTDTEKILRRVIGEDVHLAIQLDPSLGKTKADAGQLEQVLLNLAINSRDAMAHGGTITIQTHNVDVERIPKDERIPLEAGSWVMLSFGDTGAGMDAATQARVFEPFFTTKEPGKGTGLGLSTVYGIIRQSGGHVFIQSQPGIGTTFRIYLPRVQDKPQAPPLNARETMARSHEKVLLVEDEEGVRSLMAKSLRTKGYTVLEARDGLEALRVVTESEGTLDVLVTDVVLPNMGGIDLAQSLRVGKKDLPVVYLSGYTEQAVLRDAHLGPLTQFIQKPLSTEELARAVRELLDARSRR